MVKAVMNKKVLSLCFPTYNRGWCMKEQIERLRSCPKAILDKMEIIVSDNCSTDDTQEIVQTAIKNGFDCKYIRNETNLGMDGNFVSCFRKASGRYVWLLGDDDIIIIDSLVEIVKLLDVPDEYGLLHIYQKSDLHQRLLYIDDSERMVKYISYYVTFISANIVNTKYVSSIDFEKYMGTWFTLVPLYLVAVMQESLNIVFGQRTFEAAKDYIRNGGYNFFEVFVKNYLTIYNEYIKNAKLYAWIKKDIWPFVWQYTIRLLIYKNRGNFNAEQGWKILFKYYGTEWYFWWTIIKYPLSFIKRKIVNLKLL